MRSLRYGGIYALPDGTKVVAYSNGAGGYVCYELIEGEGAGEAQGEPALRTGTFIYLIDAQGHIFRCERCEGWTLDALTDTGRTGHVFRVA